MFCRPASTSDTSVKDIIAATCKLFYSKNHSTVTDIVNMLGC
jgi:hypothetical protein